MDIKPKQTEGLSTTRPPYFNGTNYNYWKTRMRIFLSSNDFDVWQIILSGHQDPLLNRDSWNELEKKAHTINAKAMNALYCALNETEFNRVSLCSTAKEIWDLLEVTHEGTSQVKESKISLLTHKYEIFRMEEGETINTMYNRFNDIVVGLKGLGKVIGKAELNRKLLLSLPKEWRPKVTAIEEAKDLNLMTMEELLGSLITHEHTLQMDKEEVEINKRKKKDLALRIFMDDENEDFDEEMALITRKFKNLIKRRSNFNPRRHDEEDKGKDLKREFKAKDKREISQDRVQCYKCKGYGHMMNECPSKDRDLDVKGKKVLQASMESDDENDEDKFSEFCFMGIEEEKEEDFERAFEELYVESICLAKKNKALKEQLEDMGLENKCLEEKLECKELELKHAKDDKEKLQQLLDTKEKEFNKLLGGSHKLTNMLLNNKSPHCKMGLGGENHNGNYNKPLQFIKASTPTHQDHTHEASTSKGKKPMNIPKGKTPQQRKEHPYASTRMIQLAPRHPKRSTSTSTRWGKAQAIPSTSHASIMCHYCCQNGHTQWKCMWKRRVQLGEAKWLPKKDITRRGIKFFIP